MKQATQKPLTLVGIQQALDSSPYKGKGQTFFHCDPLLLNIIERASTAGYILRTSHTQAEWTEEGLQKARLEIPERDLTDPSAYPDNKKLFDNHLNNTIMQNNKLLTYYLHLMPGSQAIDLPAGSLLLRVELDTQKDKPSMIKCLIESPQAERRPTKFRVAFDDDEIPAGYRYVGTVRTVDNFNVFQAA